MGAHLFSVLFVALPGTPAGLPAAGDFSHWRLGRTRGAPQKPQGPRTIWRTEEGHTLGPHGTHCHWGLTGFLEETFCTHGGGHTVKTALLRHGRRKEGRRAVGTGGCPRQDSFTCRRGAWRGRPHLPCLHLAAHHTHEPCGLPCHLRGKTLLGLSITHQQTGGSYDRFPGDYMLCLGAVRGMGWRRGHNHQQIFCGKILGGRAHYLTNQLLTVVVVPQAGGYRLVLPDLLIDYDPVGARLRWSQTPACYGPITPTRTTPPGQPVAPCCRPDGRTNTCPPPLVGD